jgi:HEAT repeat protein
MRKTFPQEVTEACLWYLGSRGLDAAGQQMAFWLTCQAKYMDVLFDPSVLPTEMASKALVTLKTADPQFFANFLKAATTAQQSPHGIMRALALLPAIGDFSPLLSMLRGLSGHPDQRVRSKVTKVLCELRPNKGLVDRQMLSDDPRVRASAIEALWYAPSPDKVEIFRSALSDAHHRVVANGLVGLHLSKDSTAFEKIIDLTVHPEPMFRAAMAWALGFILEVRGIPTLERLSRDSSTMVKKRALQSLVTLETLQLRSEEADLAAAEKLNSQTKAADSADEALPTAPTPEPAAEPAEEEFAPRFLTF